MAADGVTAEFGVKHCQISRLISDNPSDPAPVYGDPIDVPGIQTISYTENYTEETLTGDDKNLDVQASRESLELEIEHGMLSHAIRALVSGGDHKTYAAPVGKTTSEYHVKGGSEAAAFKIEAWGTKTSKPNTMCHFVAYKVKATSGSSERSYGAYRTNSFSAQAVPCLSNDALYNESELEGGNTDDTGNTRGPQVASTTPVHKAVGVLIGANIVITYDKAMDEDFALPEYFSIWNETDATSVTGFTVAYAANAFTLNPASDLGNSKTYRVTASGALRDAYGNPVGMPYSFTFTTAAS